MLSGTHRETYGGVSDALLSQLSDFVAAQMGLHFPRERWADLRWGIESAARELNFEDVASCIRWLISSPLTGHQVEILASHLTVGETYFFREPHSFQALEAYLLPKLIEARRRTSQQLRIWSAACCTGEEPYSIAMLLSTLIPDLKDWNISILATDINPRFLQKASVGVYSQWSFRSIDPWMKAKYFSSTEDGRFQIHSQLKKLVHFSYHNLVKDPFPLLCNNSNAMDLIFCRNALIYFAPEPMKIVIEAFHRCLADSGWLVVSPTEASHVEFSNFVTVHFPGATFYRKESQREHPAGDVDTVALHLHSSRPIGNGFPAASDVATPFQIDSSGISLLQSLDEDPAEVLDDLPAEAPSFDLESQPGAAGTGLTHQSLPQDLSSSLYQQAQVLYKRGHYAQAAEKLAPLTASMEAPPDGKVMILLARSYANQGELAEALRWCEQAVAVDKLEPSNHYLLATILQEMGQVERAQTSLRHTLYLDPEFVLAHVALGNLRRQQGRIDESDKHFGNALQLLHGRAREDWLSESEGITVARMTEIITFITKTETPT